MIRFVPIFSRAFFNRVKDIFFQLDKTRLVSESTAFDKVNQFTFGFIANIMYVAKAGLHKYNYGKKL